MCCLMQHKDTSAHQRAYVCVCVCECVCVCVCWTDGIPIVWANSSNGRASGQEARDAGGKGGGVGLFRSVWAEIDQASAPSRFKTLNYDATLNDGIVLDLPSVHDNSTHKLNLPVIVTASFVKLSFN